MVRGVPMGWDVLLDTYNSSLASGTGISTYSRGLAAANNAMGNTVTLLTGARVPFSLRKSRRRVRSLAAPDATLIFDNPDSPRTFKPPAATDEQWYVRNRFYSLRSFFAESFGHRLDVHPVGQVEPLDRRLFRDRLGEFSGLLNVSNIYDRAFNHFKRTGRMLELPPQRNVRIAHFSWCIPIKLLGAANIYTIHDLMPITIPSLVLEDKSHFFSLARTVAQEASAVFTVSESSREEIVRVLGVPADKVINTYQATDPNEHAPAPWGKDEAPQSLATLFGLSYKKYFLFCGSLEPRKNLSRLIEAYLASGTAMPLVVCGPRHPLTDGELAFKELRERLRQAGANPPKEGGRIIQLEFVPRHMLLLLLAGARALLMPSITEGFGLTALEAMREGTAVVVSNTGALPEVCGDAGIYVNPYSIPEIRRAIQMIERCSDAALRSLEQRSLRQAARFSMDAYVTRLRDAYAAVLGSPAQ